MSSIQLGSSPRQRPRWYWESSPQKCSVGRNGALRTWVSDKQEAGAGAPRGGLAASEPLDSGIYSMSFSLTSASLVQGTCAMLSPQVEFSGWARDDHSEKMIKYAKSGVTVKGLALVQHRR